jgi:hypothetical protein
MDEDQLRRATKEFHLMTFMKVRDMDIRRKRRLYGALRVCPDVAGDIFLVHEGLHCSEFALGHILSEHTRREQRRV